MSKGMRLVAVVLCAFIGGSASQLWAQDIEVDKETVLAVYTAFECSALARIAEFSDEGMRFRDIGYSAGLEVHAALEEGRVTRQELTVPVPAMNLLTIEGPTADFVLGVHYEFAFSMLMMEVMSSIGLEGSRAARRVEAHKRYLEKGCPEILLRNP